MRWILIFSLIVSTLSLQAEDQPIRRRFGHAPQNSASHFFDSDDVKIHYTVEGEGEPVLLIHGFRANANMNWRAPGVVKMLAEEYQVISIDNRGHGESDKPEADGMYGVKMVEDCVRLLDHLKIEKAHWVGYSMGGMITLKALTMHPERIRSAIIGGMGWMESREQNPVRDLDREDPNESTAYRACLKGFPEMTFSRDELLAIKIPMTVLIGAEDPLFGRYVKPLQEARPDLPVVVIPEANHLTCVMNPEFKVAISKALHAQAGASR